MFNNERFVNCIYFFKISVQGYLVRKVEVDDFLVYSLILFGKRVLKHFLNAIHVTKAL